MSRKGILYAGTGESNPGSGSLTYSNASVFVLNDGGTSWNSLGSAKNTGSLGHI